MVASRHLSGYQGAEVIIVLIGDSKNIKTEETTANWSIIRKMKSIKIIEGNDVLELAKKELSNSRHNY